MFLPLGTDRDGRRRAIAVPVLVAINVIVYVAMRAGAASHWLDPASGIDPIEAALDWAALNPRDMHWWQWITSLFTHDLYGHWHLIGNMIFLWAFGKTVESHVGWWRFLILYFAAGFAASGAQLLASSAPSIGASGAISGVAGFFIALFPRSHTRIFYFFTLSVMWISSAWLITLYVAIDLAKFVLDKTGAVHSGVATAAHLGGMAFGILGGLALLKLGFVPRGDWDLLYATKQFMRRRRLNSALRDAPGTPWMSGTPRGAVTRGGSVDGATAVEARLRALVQTRLRERDGPGAVSAYRDLVRLTPTSTLSIDAQLDIANRAMAEGDAKLAAQAYANFLASYPSESKAGEVRLMLAIVYIRKLRQPAQAKQYLQGLTERLHDEEQRELARTLIAESQAGAPA